jgi:hypothetical protein
MLDAVPSGAVGVAFLLAPWAVGGLAWLRSRGDLPGPASVAAYQALVSGAIVGAANFAFPDAVEALALGFGCLFAGIGIQRIDGAAWVRRSGS